MNKRLDFKIQSFDERSDDKTVFDSKTHSMATNNNTKMDSKHQQSDFSSCIECGVILLKKGLCQACRVNICKAIQEAGVEYVRSNDGNKLRETLSNICQTRIRLD
jgi:hypothetical protein